MTLILTIVYAYIQAFFAQTEDTNIFLYQPENLRRVEVIVTVIVASFWLITPTYAFYYVSRPVTRGFVFLVCLVGFSIIVKPKSTNSKYELLLALTA